MDQDCLNYRLTDEERRQFETTGLLILEGALDQEQVTTLTAAIDGLYHTQLTRGHDPRTALFYPNFIPANLLFASLVDYAHVLPKVWGILGWNIYLYHAHLIVTPPVGVPRDDATFGWHQDSGRVNLEMEARPRPRLSLKVAYFLSDTSMEGCGNFWVRFVELGRGLIAFPALLALLCEAGYDGWILDDFDYSAYAAGESSIANLRYLRHSLGLVGRRGHAGWAG